MHKNMRQQGGFALAGTLAICIVLMALSAGLIMRTSQSRMGMRTMAAANQYQMSLDSVLRQFGTMASEMAVAGAGGGAASGAVPLEAFSSTASMTAAIREALPAEWTNSGGLISSTVSVTSWPGANTTISGTPQLMTRGADWKVLSTGELRSSILPPGQNFVGRSWGYRAQVGVSIQDNLVGLEASWQRRRDGSLSFTTNTNRTMFSNVVSTFMTITEMPAQFSIQGQNLAMTNVPTGQTNTIGGGTRASTILGRNVDLDGRIAGGIAKTTKVVARGGIAKKTGWRGWDSSVYTSDRQRIASQAEAGAAAQQDLEEAGSAVLVNVGTRGPEIFRSPQDYETIIRGDGRGTTTPMTSAGREFLKYWLPYYQCNFRVTFSLDPSTVRHSGAAVQTYSMSDIEFVAPGNIRIPANRDKTVPLGTTAPGFAAISTNIPTEGRVGLYRGGQKRPIGAAMRALRAGGGSIGGTPSWVNTIDIDLEGFLDLIKNTAPPAGAGMTAGQWRTNPVGLHIDIRDKATGGIFPNAIQVPVVIRKAREIGRPFSIVTPGTVHIQGKFGSTAGNVHPFSIFAPRVKFGMEGRKPSEVGIRGQRVGVGSSARRSSDVLSVESGKGTEAVSKSDTRLSNIGVTGPVGSSADGELPPVFLKDWLVETYNDF